MSERYSPLWELTLARIREILREPGFVFWIFGFPVILVIIWRSSSALAASSLVSASAFGFAAFFFLAAAVLIFVTLMVEYF